jgi:transporter family protein
MRVEFASLGGFWLFWALLAAIFAALTAISAKIGVEGVDSDLATLARTIVVVFALTALLAATGRLRPAAINPKSFIFLALSGLATGASWLCYFRALKLGDASRVAPIDKLSVVMVALFGVVFLGERLSLSNWLGVALIAGGALLVAFR